MLRNIKVFIHSSDEFHDSVFVFLITFESLSSRTLDDRSVVTIETILVEKFADVHLDELNQLWVSQVHLV